MAFCRLFLCLAEDCFTDLENFYRREQTHYNLILFMDCCKGKWNDDGHDNNWLSSCLLKLTLERFWDAHSNSDSFHVQKEAN